MELLTIIIGCFVAVELHDVMSADFRMVVVLVTLIWILGKSITALWGWM